MLSEEEHEEIKSHLNGDCQCKDYLTECKVRILELLKKHGE